MKNMTIREKIEAYLKEKSITKLQMESALGRSKGYLNKIDNPTYEVLHDICRIYSDISAEWLLRGEGEMLRKIEPEAPLCAANEILTLIKSLNDKIDNMSSQIDELKKTDARPDEDAACAVAG